MGAVVKTVGIEATATHSATIEVGPGKTFARIEDANEKAKPGDVILVYPLEGGVPYKGTTVYVRQKGITFRGVTDDPTGRVKISGEGFDYSGRGSTPRAIFQFNRGADNCVLEGFELSGAHNESQNGAGVRINQANNVMIRSCNIHHNDMGIMSNGDGTPDTGRNQRIEYCAIHHNGSFDHPGFNHNLYLGGTSVTLSYCDIHSSLTGHNVKSRAHFTRVEYCYVHDSANREFDLVDSADTARPNSHAVAHGKCDRERSGLQRQPGSDSLWPGRRGASTTGRSILCTTPSLRLSSRRSSSFRHLKPRLIWSATSFRMAVSDRTTRQSSAFAMVRKRRT